jgi:hypothetical protein
VLPPAFVHTGRLLGLGVPIVNQAHPLARALQACYVPAFAPAGKIINLAAAGSGDLVTRTGTPVNVLTPEGLGFNCSVAASQHSIQAGNTPVQFQMATGMSAFVRGQWIGYASNNVPDNILGIEYNATPFWAWGIGVGATQAVNSSALNAPCYFYDQGSTTFTNGQGATTALTNKQMFSVGFVGFSASGSQRLWVNGVNQTNVSGVNAMNANHYGSLSPLITLGNTNSGRTGASIITVGYIWGRQLTAGEMRYLDANPYALLLWPSDLATMVVGGSAPSIISGTLSETFPDFTLAGTGLVGSLGSLSETFADFTLSGTGRVGAIGSLSETFADFTLSGSGLIGNHGSLSEAFADFTLSGSGLLGNQGSLSESIGTFTGSLSGLVGSRGSLSETIPNFTLVATGGVGGPVSGTVIATLPNFTLLAEQLSMTVGTITQVFNNTRNLVVTISGITASGTTPSFLSRGFVIGSWQATGTFGSGTLTLYGSNDNSNFFSLATGITSAGIVSLIQTNNLVPLWYQFQLAGATSPSITVVASLMSTFG